MPERQTEVPEEWQGVKPNPAGRYRSGDKRRSIELLKALLRSRSDQGGAEPSATPASEGRQPWIYETTAPPREARIGQIWVWEGALRRIEALWRDADGVQWVRLSATPEEAGAMGAKKSSGATDKRYEVRVEELRRAGNYRGMEGQPPTS